MSCAPRGFSNAGGAAVIRALPSGRRWPDSSAFAFLSRSHSGRGIQQDLTAFVKLMHIDMNYGDVVETLLRAQTRRNGAVPISIYPRVKKEIF